MALNSSNPGYVKRTDDEKKELTKHLEEDSKKFNSYDSRTWDALLHFPFYEDTDARHALQCGKSITSHEVAVFEQNGISPVPIASAGLLVETLNSLSTFSGKEGYIKWTKDKHTIIENMKNSKRPEIKLMVSLIEGILDGLFINTGGFLAPGTHPRGSEIVILFTSLSQMAKTNVSTQNNNGFKIAIIDTIYTSLQPGGINKNGNPVFNQTVYPVFIKNYDQISYDQTQIRELEALNKGDPHKIYLTHAPSAAYQVVPSAKHNVKLNWTKPGTLPFFMDITSQKAEELLTVPNTYLLRKSSAFKNNDDLFVLSVFFDDKFAKKAYEPGMPVNKKTFHYIIYKTPTGYKYVFPGDPKNSPGGNYEEVAKIVQDNGYPAILYAQQGEGHEAKDDKGWYNKGFASLYQMINGRFTDFNTFKTIAPAIYLLKQFAQSTAPPTITSFAASAAPIASAPIVPAPIVPNAPRRANAPGQVHIITNLGSIFGKFDYEILLNESISTYTTQIENARIKLIKKADYIFDTRDFQYARLPIKSSITLQEHALNFFIDMYNKQAINPKIIIISPINHNVIRYILYTNGISQTKFIEIYADIHAYLRTLENVSSNYVYTILDNVNIGDSELYLILKDSVNKILVIYGKTSSYYDISSMAYDKDIWAKLHDLIKTPTEAKLEEIADAAKKAAANKAAANKAAANKTAKNKAAANNAAKTKKAQNTYKSMVEKSMVKNATDNKKIGTKEKFMKLFGNYYHTNSIPQEERNLVHDEVTIHGWHDGGYTRRSSKRRSHPTKKRHTRNKRRHTRRV